MNERPTTANVEMKLSRPFAAWMERATTRRSVGGNWPATLGRSQVFILPSGFGLIAAAATTIMLLVALNYQNSPAFLLAFLLGALLLVAMVACHQHLHGLAITSARADAVFAGDPIVLKISVVNRGRRARHGLSCYAEGNAGHTANLAPGAETFLRLALAPRRRGRHSIGRCGLATSEPLGVFRAWSQLRPIACIVYPRPAAQAPPPPGTAELATHGMASHLPEDFIGLARYRPGDRPSQIAWPAWARGGVLERKAFGGTGGGVLWLDFADAPGRDIERRLSVLAAWALKAERGGARWGLHLPGHALAPGRGPVHLHRGLTELALYPGPYEST